MGRDPSKEKKPRYSESRDHGLRQGTLTRKRHDKLHTYRESHMDFEVFSCLVPDVYICRYVCVGRRISPQRRLLTD